MSFSINQALLAGNISSTPELRYTQNGTAVCTFSMATNRNVKKNDGQFESVATFHRVVVWRKLGEWISKNAKKGDKVVVRGRIYTRSYEKDGQPRYLTEIVAEDVIPSSRRDSGSVQEADVQGDRQETVYPPDDSENSSYSLADEIPV